MADEYTPTTDEVREKWREPRAPGSRRRGAEFDRWLAGERAPIWDEGVLLLASRHNISVGPDWLRLSNPYRDA